MQITISNANITGEGGSITNATITGNATLTPPSEPPLVIWGPGDPRPTLPIAGWNPGTGTFPIPPTEPQPPLDFWGGGSEEFPTNPIAEPPWGWGNPAPPIDPPLPPGIEYKYMWTPETGWITVIIPSGPVVTPSKK